MAVIKIQVNKENVRHYYGGAFGTGKCPDVTPTIKLGVSEREFLTQLGVELGKSVSNNVPEVFLDLNYFLSNFKPSGLLAVMDGLRLTGHSCMDIDYSNRNGENRDLLIRFFNAVETRNQHESIVNQDISQKCSQETLGKYEAYMALLKKEDNNAK